jgi:hypothetical protein
VFRRTNSEVLVESQVLSLVDCASFNLPPRDIDASSRLVLLKRREKKS